MARFLFTMVPAGDLSLIVGSPEGDPLPGSVYPIHIGPNARRTLALGTAEIVLPTTDTDGEQRIDVQDFAVKAQRVLTQPGYRQAAQRAAGSMRKLGGISEAANRIERLVA